MDPRIQSFQEICGPVWSIETIRKMIAKHGLDICVDMALEGIRPDVDTGPIETIVILDDGTPKMDDDKPMAMFEEPAKEVATLPDPSAVVVDLDGDHTVLEFGKSTDVELSTNNEKASPEPVNKTIIPAVLIADDEPIGPTHAPVELVDSQEEDPLRPDPFFSKMTDLADDDEDDHARAELELSMVRKSPGRPKKRPSPNNEESAPEAKRMATSAQEEEQVRQPQAPAVPSLMDAVPLAHGVPNPRAPSTVAHMSKLRQPNEAEKAFLKTLAYPTRLCDLPPHAFGRMMSLQTAASRANGSLLGNLMHWKSIQQAQLVTGEKWRKSPPMQRSEVLMIVDADFAFSDFGTPIMDELQVLECPVTCARLPCRNTIIWRRKDPEANVKASTTQKPGKSTDHHTGAAEDEEEEIEPGGMIGARYVGGRNRKAANAVASSSVGPLTKFQYDIDHCLLLLTPEQWASAHYNNFEIPGIEDAKRCYPGKTLSILILHKNSNYKYGDLSHSDVGLLTIQMQLRHELHTLVIENGSRPAQVAFILSQLSKSFAIRPYEYLAKDGPFYSFDPESDERTGSRDKHASYQKMLQAAGVDPSAAVAIMAQYKSPLALFQAFNTAPNDAFRSTMLKSLRTSSGTSIGAANSSAAYAAFSADAANPRPYRSLRRVPADP